VRNRQQKETMMAMIGTLYVRALYALVFAVSAAPTASAAARSAPAAKQPALSTATLRIEGMHCDGCALFIRQALEDVKGVKSAKIEVKAKKGTVRYNPAVCRKQQLIAAVKKAGYKASVAE